MIKSLLNKTSKTTLQKNSIVSYDDFGETFGKSRKDLHWPELDEILADLADENFISGTKKIADIGCGNGRLLKNIIGHQKSDTLRTIFSHYVGLDMSSVLLNQARADDALNTGLTSVNWIQGDMRNAEELLTDFGTFDVIFFIASFHHLDSFTDRIDVLSQAKKLLSPQGKIIMTNWNLLDVSQVKYRDSQTQKYLDGSADYDIKIGEHTRFYHAFSSQEYHELARQSGLTILRESFLERNSIVILQ